MLDLFGHLTSSLERAYCLAVGLVLIGVDCLRWTFFAQLQFLRQEAPRRFRRATRRQPEVDDLTVLVERKIKLRHQRREGAA